MTPTEGVCALRLHAVVYVLHLANLFRWMNKKKINAAFALLALIGLMLDLTKLARVR
jgi:hypothetical protein